MMEGRHADGTAGPTAPVMELAKAAGEVLGRPDGPRVATIDFGGWDTHISQQGEYSQLTRNLRLLDRSVAALKMALGPVWQHTAVLIVWRRTAPAEPTTARPAPPSSPAARCRVAG
jgi:uncharacterized protein (DUF1501 family)